MLHLDERRGASSCFSRGHFFLFGNFFRVNAESQTSFVVKPLYLCSGNVFVNNHINTICIYSNIVGIPTGVSVQGASPRNSFLVEAAQRIGFVSIGHRSRHNLPSLCFGWLCARAYHPLVLYEQYVMRQTTSKATIKVDTFAENNIDLASHLSGDTLCGDFCGASQLIGGLPGQILGTDGYHFTNDKTH